MAYPEMTPEQIAAAWALVNAATKGPWRVGPVDDTRVEDAAGNEVSQIDGDYNEPDLWPFMEANAAFIAASRTLIPQLLTALEAERAKVAKLVDVLDKADQALHDDGCRPTMWPRPQIRAILASIKETPHV